VRKSATVRQERTVFPLSRVTFQRTSAGVTGRPPNLPGTGSDVESNASTASCTRPQSPSGVSSVPLWFENVTSRIVGLVWSTNGVRCPSAAG
jgi:hypothetical protein